MMAAYNLVVANQSAVHTYEMAIVRSVLDLLFVSPEVIKNISSWKVLDAEFFSDYRYTSTKLTWKVLLLQKKQQKYL